MPTVSSATARRPGLSALAVLLCATAAAGHVAGSQAGQAPVTPADILQALDNLQQARGFVVQSGDAAVEPAVAVLRGNPSLNLIHTAVLVGALGEIDSPRSQRALIALLADTSAQITAVAASVVAARRIGCAVPALLHKLDDNRVYAQQNFSHGTPRDLTVAEAADDALARLTGASAKSRGRERIRGFERWWARHQRTARCDATP